MTSGSVLAGGEVAVGLFARGADVHAAAINSQCDRMIRATG